MNHIYRIVFNRSLGQLQVVGETTRAPRSGTSGSSAAQCLLCGTLLSLCLATPAAAAITHTNNATITGGNGADGSNDIGGAGGSAGMGSGNGGTGGNGGSGSPFVDGTSGSHGSGGGQGGNLGSINGGATGGGGAGGFADIFGRDGGGGGGGGASGIIDSGTSTIINNGTISGGNGGNGANPNGVIGSGGGGGNGITLTSSNGSQITNNAGAIISGGHGGGGSALANAGGSGGDGIFLQGDGNTITNAGSISGGGAAYQGNANGRAIQLVGNNNSLELHGTSVITGNVAASGTGNSLTLTGTSNGSLAGLGTQYSGFSELIKTGTSTWTLTSPSTFSGPTTVSAGILQAGATGAFSSNSAFTLSNGTTLDLNGFDQSIGSLAGGGTVELGSGTLTSGGNDTSTAFAGAINGTGGLTKSGTGTLTLIGLNGYTGLTTIHAGALQIGNGGASGSIAGDILNNGALSFNHYSSIDYTYAFDISGNGVLNKTDNNVLTLTGNNTYTGLTTLSAGTLQIGDGGTSGSLTGNVLNNSALVFNRADDSTYAGDISGSGTLAKLGAGKLVLEGISSIGGDTRVDAGSLIVGGSAGSSANLTSDVDVASGALLGGHGRITGNVDLASGATLAPGNSIGTLSVNGDVTFNSGSTLEIEANPDGSSDRLISTGTVSLGGSRLNVLAGAGTWSPSTSYSIVQAASLNGTFGSVSSNLAFLTPELNYSATGVGLTLERNDISYISVAQTYNQRAVADVLESADDGSLYDAIEVLSAEQARAAYDSLSGELHASTRGALFDDSRYAREAVTDRLRTGQSGLASGDVLHSDAESGLTFWLTGYGSWSDKDGNSNVADLDRDSRGTLIGLDLPLNQTWRLGIAAGYGTSDLDVSHRESSADIDSTSLIAYLGGQWDALSLRMGVARTWNEVDSKRDVQVGALRETLKANYDADTTQVFGELGYALQLGELTLEPFAGLAHVEVDSDGFHEHGGTAALSGNSEDDSGDYASLGLRAAAPLGDIADLPLSLHTSLAWQHAFDEPSDESRLSLAGYDSFTVKGVPVADDSALAQLGLDLQLSPQASIGLGYSGQFGDGNSDQGVRVTLSTSF